MQNPPEKNPRELRLGFLGLGAVGTPLARNALEDGRTVVVCDPDGAAVQRLAAAGAAVAETARGLAGEVDMVQVAVATGEQLQAALLDAAEGFLAGARPGQAVIIHSTVGAQVCAAIAKEAQRAGVAVVDAPVTGPDSAPQSAARREMTTIVGAEPAALAQVREVLEISCSAIFHVGAVGDAQSVKLAANALALVQMQATHETMRLLAHLGVGGADAAAILSVSSADNWAVAHWDMVSQAGRAAGNRAIPAKDMELAAETARAAGLRLDLAERVRYSMSEAGHGFLAPS